MQHLSKVEKQPAYNFLYGPFLYHCQLGIRLHGCFSRWHSISLLRGFSYGMEKAAQGKLEICVGLKGQYPQILFSNPSVVGSTVS